MTKNYRTGRKDLRKGRYSQTNGIYFVTAVTEKRRAWFQDFNLAGMMSRYLHGCGRRLEIEVLCWVVMPDHVHLLVDIRQQSLTKSMGRLKTNSARTINQAVGRRGRFWSDGFHDHGLRSEEPLLDISRYIVANPVRAGIVKSVRQYPFWNAVWF